MYFVKLIIRTVCMVLMGVCLVNFALQAQDNPVGKISISSPTAASLGKYGDIPVSYHTGVPQVNIPLYTASAGPLSLNIGLNYHASGLKVQEPAGWVGAGWSLDAGGVITRSVMGAPDEKGTNGGVTQTGGHFSDYGYNSYINASAGHQDWQGFARGEKDGEPDLYFFNFGGHSGKFYFRDDRTPVCVPEEDIKIVPYYTGTGSIQAFTVITPDGVKYEFGNSLGMTGTAPIEITRTVTSDNGLATSNIVSSWYLNKITSPDDQFHIDLSYQAENYSYFTVPMFAINGVPAAGGSGSPPENRTGFSLVKNIVTGARLSTISFTNGTVNFLAGIVRTDLGDNTPTLLSDPVNQQATSLGGISISNGADFCKRYDFTYGYFEDTTTQLPTEISNWNPSPETDKRRLKLLTVQEFSCDNAVSKPPHVFSYFGDMVPRRLSFGIDHWGFYNGAASNQSLIPEYTVKYGVNQTTYPGADRDAHWPALRGGTLQQITYPTCGYSVFDFEPNSVFSTLTETRYESAKDLYVRLYGQNMNIYSQTVSFTADGPYNVSINNGYNSPATLIIKDANNTIIQNLQATENSNYQTTITLQQGNYTVTLSIPQVASPVGGVEAHFYHWVDVTTTSNKTIGGLRIKSISHNDGISPANITTSYNYNSGSQSTGILYGRPVYVGIIRNDLLRDVGYLNVGTGTPTPTLLTNGCPSIIGPEFFKSPNSIRPMATTQGNNIGYSKVTVSQTGNGYSTYEYYGSQPWQVAADGDIAVRKVNTSTCDINAPNFPSAPLPFEYMRGELKKEAHYNEAGQLLKEASYTPVFESNPVQTPAFIATSQASTLLATNYTIATAKKIQTQVVSKEYTPGAGSIITTSTSYNESPWHNNVTRTMATNSTGEVLESKIRYAFDFRLPNCDGIANGYAAYSADCNTCLATYNNAIQSCGTDRTCLTNTYLAYLQCKTNARVNYVAYRRTNFTDPTNVFKTGHDNAKAAADGELKPILQLQDNFINARVESTKWRNGNLLGATFNKYAYGNNITGNPNAIFLNSTQAVNVSETSSNFTNSATSPSATSIVKDTRYIQEAVLYYYNGNVAEVTGKDGVTTSYLWGYNNTLPIAKGTGTNQATLLSAYNATGGNLSQLRSQPSLAGALVNTYSYSPLLGMTSETGPDGRPISYQYDGLGRLLRAKDFNNNILKQYDYQYCKPALANHFYNTVQSLVKTRNNCGCGEQGSSVTYTINANTYVSANSQADADHQAIYDLLYNGQAYANTNGLCTPVSCTGPDKRMINCQCVTGQRVNTSTRQRGFLWYCTYHYVWPDGYVSPDYTETSKSPCNVEGG